MTVCMTITSYGTITSELCEKTGGSTLPSALTYRSASARRAEILEVLNADGAYVSHAELSKRFEVSEMTIRRDARMLEQRGLARLVTGGVCLVREPLAENDFRLRSEREVHAKREIAAAALTLIRDNSTVAFDAGSTVLELARKLTFSHRLKVVTASLPVMCLLGDRPNIELIGLGGVLRSRTQAFAGPATIEALTHIRADQVFLGTGAIRTEAMGNGVYEGNTWDSEVKRALISSTDEVVLLADSTKFDRTAVAKFGSLSDIDIVVVDDRITSSDVELLTAAGIRVVKAEPIGETSPLGLSIPEAYT